MHIPIRRAVVLGFGLLVIPMIQACGVGVQPLMPTPVLYTESGYRPLDHIPEHERWIPRRVFYATNRARVGDAQRIDYSNKVSDRVSVGMALVGFGDDDMTWAALDHASTSETRDPEVNLSLSGIMEKGRYNPADPPEVSAAPVNAGFMLDSVRDQIEDARDKDILIYIHGAKVNFYNACVFAAQLDHFMGRDMTSVAFSWPTHQNIVSYVDGVDIARAYDSAQALTSLIEMLADHTEAEKIHVLCWSAGARVTMQAIAALTENRRGEDITELRERFRLGTVYFAAGDVSTDEFLTHMEPIHGLCDQLVISQTDDDNALKASRRFIGGDTRIGQEGSRLTSGHLEEFGHLDRLEVVDVSIAAEQRGFDITGHRYWFTHPWASSDVLLSIRTRLGPAERGLEPGDHPTLWGIPSDYPDRLRGLLESSDIGPWSASQSE